MRSTYARCFYLTVVLAGLAWPQGGVPPHLRLLPSSNNSTTNELRFMELYMNGSNFFAIKAPGAMTSNVVLTWPPVLGPAGSTLAVDGTGQLSWTPSLGTLTATAGRYLKSDGVTWVASGGPAAGAGVCPSIVYEGGTYPTAFPWQLINDNAPVCDQVRHVSVAPELKTFQYATTIADAAGLDFPFVIPGGGAAAYPHIFTNTAKRIKLTAVTCKVDVGTLSVNLMHDNGTGAFANTLATNLTCTTAGGTSGVFNSPAELYQPGESMWLALGSALGGQKWISVTAVYVLY